MRIKLATVLHRGGGEKEGQGDSSQPGSSLQPDKLTISPWGSSLLLCCTGLAKGKRDRAKQQPTRIQLTTAHLTISQWGSSLLLCCTGVAEIKRDWTRRQSTKIQLTNLNIANQDPVNNLYWLSRFKVFATKISADYGMKIQFFYKSPRICCMWWYYSVDPGDSHSRVSGLIFTNSIIAGWVYICQWGQCARD